MKKKTNRQGMKTGGRILAQHAQSPGFSIAKSHIWPPSISNVSSPISDILRV